MAAFLASLAHDDLAPATLRGYRYDLRHFVAWHHTVHDSPFALHHLAGYELAAYRQHMVGAGFRPATVNRRLDAVRRLCRWARATGALAPGAATDVRPVRTTRNRQPAGLTDPETHALLRAAGASSHGLAARNYAMVQLMLQAGLRVGELAALQVGDLTLGDRSGTVRIRHGKGLKARDVPLNATARRALRQHLDRHPSEDMRHWLREGAIEGRSAAELLVRAEGKLRAWHVTLPATSTLERLVAAEVTQATSQLYDTVSLRLPPSLREAIDLLVEMPEGDARSSLFRLKDFPKSASAAAIKGDIVRLRLIEQLVEASVGLDDLDPRVVRQLGQLGRRYDAGDLRRFAKPKRDALVAWYLVEARKTLLDQVVEMNDLFLTGTNRRARNAVEKQCKTLTSPHLVIQAKMLVNGQLVLRC